MFTWTQEDRNSPLDDTMEAASLVMQRLSRLSYALLAGTESTYIESILQLFFTTQSRINYSRKFSAVFGTMSS